MKLHDPAEEREFLRIASLARAGRPIEFGDGLEIGERVKDLLLLIFILAMVARPLSGIMAQGLDDHWSELIACLILMVTAACGCGALEGTAGDCGVHSVLPNLPISGENSFRWIRSRFFLRCFWKIVCVCAVISIMASKTALDARVLLGNIALLSAMTAASMMLTNDEWIRKLKLTLVWQFVSWAFGGFLVWMFVFHRHYYLPGHTPDWIVSVVQGITWVFPYSWAMGGRFESGGKWLCAIWIGWGFWKWMIWPRVAGSFLDAPLDRFAGYQDEDDEEDEDCVSEQVPENEAESEVPAIRHSGPITLPAPLAMNQVGWVDRWVDAVIGERCCHLAGAICDPNVTWTKRTMRLIKIAPFWLLSAWLLLKWLPAYGDTILLAAWIIPLASMIFFLLPFSNAIPRATVLWGPELQLVPFFAGLPVNVRDLLRLSSRITFARSLVMAVIAGAFFSGLLMISWPGIPPWPVLSVVSAFAVFWTLSRPVFIVYRLRSVCRHRQGVRLLNGLAVLASILLGIIWFGGGAVGIVASFALFTHELAESEVGLTYLLAFGGLIGSGLSARVVFEIHHWQLRRGHFDWLHMP